MPDKSKNQIIVAQMKALISRRRGKFKRNPVNQVKNQDFPISPVN